MTLSFLAGALDALFLAGAFDADFLAGADAVLVADGVAALTAASVVFDADFVAAGALVDDDVTAFFVELSAFLLC